MPLTPHRRHAITSMLSVIGPVCLYQHLIAPNVTAFMLRIVTQTRMSTPRIAHPSFSLFMLALGVTGSNLLAIFLHMLDESVDMDKGLVLDFVGIKNRASYTQIILIDAFIFLYQIITLYIAYLADPVPLGGVDKLLLPPINSRRSRSKDLDEDKDADEEYETRENNTIDLDEEDELEREALLQQSPYPQSHSTPPSTAPFIFHIPHLPTLLYTILTNPSPEDPVPSFGGATPVLGRSSAELVSVEEGGRIPGQFPGRGFG